MATKIQPPKHLSAEARKLWTELRADYAIDDSAGLALLRAACEASDRAQQARAMIVKDGMVSTDRFGQRKPHPAVGIERDARTQLLAALRALKLAPEPL
jgi:P27 family predicted phage terminase small subunit